MYTNKRPNMLSLLIATSLAIEDFPGDKSQVFVNYYNMIKLQNVNTKIVLSSIEFHYTSGSSQQIVRGIRKPVLAETYWSVFPLPNETSIPQGRPVECGATIRLQHAATQAWLHSHAIAGHFGYGYEVSGFDSSDSGDFWELECVGADAWSADTPVKLRHIDTGLFLAANESSVYPDETGGGYEVVATTGGNDEWVVCGGIFVDESD